MTKEPVGSVADEAAKLFAALHRNGKEPEAEPQLGADCQWCPVCQLIHRVRQCSPETMEHLAAAAAGVLGSLRALLDAAAETAREARDAGEPPGEAEPEPEPSGVDRIDVSEDPGRWD
jgi:hypothetical protein